MARNGSGAYTLPAGNPVVSGTPITASWGNTTLSDIAGELTNSLDRQGRGGALANLPMNNFKFTGLAAGSVAGDSVRYEQALNQDTATLASGATVDLAASPASQISLTGTTTVTSFGTGMPSGVRKWVTVAAAAGPITLTNSSTLICPGGSNLILQAGDTFSVRSEPANVWRVDKTPAYTYTLPDGSVSAPGLSFVSDPNCGIYRTSADNWSLAVGGLEGIRLSLGSAAHITVPTRFTVATAASATLAAPTDSISIGTGAHTNLSNSGAVSLTTGDAQLEAGVITIQAGAGTLNSPSSKGGTILIRSGGNAAGSNGVGGNLDLRASYAQDANSAIRFAVDNSGGSPLIVSRIRVQLGIPESLTGPGAPTVFSGGGTGVTLAGTNSGFIVTIGTGAGTTLAVNLTASGNQTPTGLVAVANSSNTAYEIGVATSPTLLRITLTFSIAPTSGDKIFVIPALFS